MPSSRLTLVVVAVQSDSVDPAKDISVRRPMTLAAACRGLAAGVLGCLAACATTPPRPGAEIPAPVRAVDLPDLAGAGRPVRLTAGDGSDTPAFQSLEGPYWVGAEGTLLFSDVVEDNGPGARIYRFDPVARRFSVVPYPTHEPTTTNGLAVDGRGALVACERTNARVVRVDGAHALSVLADRWPPTVSATGRPTGPSLSAPNDLAIRVDGNIYFTDSDWGARAGIAHAAMGVYRIDPIGKVSRILDTEKPNGIALSPDGAFLYVGSDTQAKIWRLPLDAQGMPGVPALFIDGATVPGGFKVPDGICVDDAGALYVTNNDDAIKAIVVFDSAGRARAKLRFPQRPSNCTFGGRDRRSLFVTTLHAIYQVRVPTPGLP